MSKLIRLSTDNTTFTSLPSNAGDLSSDGEVVDDSILGNTFESGFTSILNWTLSADGIYKGVPGYQTCILKQGTSTFATTEDLSLVSGQEYRVNDLTKDIWDADNPVIIYEDAVDVTDQVAEFNYLFGTIVFKAGYTVVGTLFADFNYFPTAVLGRFTSFTLNQSVNVVDDSDFQSLKANDGYRLNINGLRTVTLDADGIFDAASDFQQQLEARDDFILEIQADNDGNSKARGYFRIGSVNQSGSVGENEVESVSFMLSVPSSDYKPFDWSHNGSSTLNNAIIIALDAFNDETTVFMEYLPNGIGGAGGKTGEAIVSDISLESSIDDMPRLTINLTGDGALNSI